jgi:hypothetical protein
MLASEGAILTLVGGCIVGHLHQPLAALNGGCGSIVQWCCVLAQVSGKLPASGILMYHFWCPVSSDTVAMVASSCTN